jgi:ketosteroid isomerase-like protein
LNLRSNSVLPLSTTVGLREEEMSQANAEVVRQPFTVASHSRRRLDERFGLRFPGVRILVQRMLWRLPPRSQLRQASLRRALQLGFEAINRGDFEAAFAAYHGDAELISDSRLIGLGFDGVYHGRAERVRFQQRWVAEWGDFRFVPEEVLYLGDDGVFVGGRVVGTGLSSGARFDSDWGVLLKISCGRVVREQFFFDRADAVKAVELRD